MESLSQNTQPLDWPAVAVAGAGAVGCYFGGMLARAGVPVTLIGRAQHMDAIAREGLLLERLTLSERVPLRVSTGLSAVHDARVVLFCVKTVDTETVAQALRPHLAPGSTVVSLQNGVDNVERIYSAAKIRAIPAVVYVACAMVAPGHVKHSGRGDLIIGNPARRVEDAQLPGLAPEAIAAMFECAEVPCRVSQTIETDLWTKMVINCAYNAISALGVARYGRMLKCQRTRDLMQRVIEEAVAVARAEGIALDEPALTEATFKLAEAMPGALSSTAQDINRARATEIDSLNGFLVRRAARLGIQTPVNQTLYTLVKLLEDSSRE